MMEDMERRLRRKRLRKHGGGSHNDKDHGNRYKYVDDEHRGRILDWLKRHETPQASDGRYIFYHASPKDTAKIVRQNGLRPNSLLESNPEGAQFFAQRDRNLSPDEVVVFEVLVHPWEIRGGVFARVIDTVKVSKEVPVKNPIRKKLER